MTMKLEHSHLVDQCDCCSTGVAAAARDGAIRARRAPPADFGDQARLAFVVGAPRCGTTSLCGYLSSRPDLCLSNVKEPHFFSGADLRDLTDERLRRTVREDYLDRYFPRRRSSPMLAEGSVTYLYVPEQLEPIRRLWPHARFIVGVRNPLTMLPSLHQRLCYNGDETVREFARAWALVPERRRGRSVPRSCAHPRWLDYWEAGRLGKYVGQLFEAVGRERCLVYLFDDFAADPARVYREVLAFLELPDDGRREYPTHRPSRDYKIGWLQRALKRPPRSMAAVGGERYRRLFTTGPSLESGAITQSLWAARDRILAWNRAPAPTVRIDPELRSEIVAMYRDDVAHLGELLGRDLGGWLQDRVEPIEREVRAEPRMAAARAGFKPVQSAGLL